MVDLTQDHSHDDKLEDYFFDLLINKHATDKEITDLMHIIDKSKLHKDYKLKLGRLLFGDENLFIQNWGTLQQSLVSIAHNETLRDGDIYTHGVVLDLLFQMTEYIFDISDEHMISFIMSNHKEDVEHQIIALMKRLLDYFEIGLSKLLSETTALEEAHEEGSQLPSEYRIIERSLLAYPKEILSTQDERIHELKKRIDEVATDLQKSVETSL